LGKIPNRNANFPTPRSQPSLPNPLQQPSSASQFSKPVQQASSVAQFSNSTQQPSSRPGQLQERVGPRAFQSPRKVSPATGNSGLNSKPGTKSVFSWEFRKRMLAPCHFSSWNPTTGNRRYRAILSRWAIISRCIEQLLRNFTLLPVTAIPANCLPPKCPASIVHPGNEREGLNERRTLWSESIRTVTTTVITRDFLTLNWGWYRFGLTRKTPKTTEENEEGYDPYA
jgi:hypothetical protein